MAAAGAETMRVAFHWGNAQLERDGPIDLSETDRIVERASARRIEVFPHIIVAPTWNRAYSYAPHAPPGDPEYLRPLHEGARSSATGRVGASGPSIPACRACRFATGSSGTSPTSRTSGPFRGGSRGRRPMRHSSRSSTSP